MDGAEVMARAMNPAPGALTIVEERDGIVFGAASYRETEQGTKLVNIGVLEPRMGIGRRLFERVKAMSTGRMWCQSAPEAAGFYLAMGMEPCEFLPDGRRIFRMR